MNIKIFVIVAAMVFFAGCVPTTQLEDHLASCQSSAECPEEYFCAADMTCVRGSAVLSTPVTCSGACESGQYKTSECTETADRACASCTPIADCASETCTTSDDQVCTACSTNHYLDRNACRTCSGACPAGEQQSAACTATTDRACTSCTVIPGCIAETCTSTTDQVCSACAPGLFLINNTCVPCSGACGAGQYQSAACTATADRMCSSCTAIANCASETCTTSTDQTCTACGPTFYLDNNTCNACSGACPVGQQQSAACTATTDRACTSCTVIPGCTAETCTNTTDQVCTACAGGRFLRNNACDVCAPACAAGQYESTACGGTNDRACTTCTPIANCAVETCTTNADQACVTCAAGHYKVGNTCVPCSGACGAGQYQTAACTATADRTCSGCTPIANCTTETCTTNADQVCTGCDASFYVNNGVCSACSVGCAAGEYESAACGLASDRACTGCTAIPSCTNETCTTASNQVCAQCAVGHFLFNNTCPTCSVGCPSGSYQSAVCTPVADRTCTGCTNIPHCANVTCTTNADQTCVACDPGYYGPTCSSVVRSDCYAILAAGDSTGDGVYPIDPDGLGPLTAFPVYCDMTNGGWTLLNDQDTAFGFLPTGIWQAGVSTTPPNGGQWGILNRTSLFRSGPGDFEFRLTYGQTQDKFTQWRQTGDPLTEPRGLLSNVAMVPNNQTGCLGPFEGLGTDSPQAALDGHASPFCWWFAVGTDIQYGGGIPAYEDSAAGSLITDRVRFWVRRDAPLTPPDLALYYPFEDGVGSVISDVSGNAHHGALASGSWASGASCHSGSCLELTGADYASAPNTPPVTFGTGDFSVSAWARSTGVGEQIIAGNNRCNVSEGWLLSFAGGAPAFATFGAGSMGGYAVSPFAANDSQWHFIAAARKGTNVSLYLDGALVQTASVLATYDSDSGNADLQIGNLNGCPRSLEGAVDDLRLHARALNQADVATLMASEMSCEERLGCGGATPRCGTVIGAPVNGVVAGPVPIMDRFNKTAGAMNFQAGQSITFTHNTIPIGSSARTMAFWMRSNQTFGTGAMVNYGIYAGGQRFGILNAGGNEYFVGEGQDVGGNFIANGAWHHVAVSYDGTFVRLYRDGNLESTQARPLFTGSRDVFIGIALAGHGAEDYVGDLDDLRFYDRVLNDGEVVSVMTNDVSLKTSMSGLVGWYPLDGTGNEEAARCVP